MTNQPTGDALPEGLAAPARRALTSAGITNLHQLAKISKDDITALHGMGPKALRQLQEALTQTGLSFAHTAQQ